MYNYQTKEHLKRMQVSVPVHISKPSKIQNKILFLIKEVPLSAPFV